MSNPRIVDWSVKSEKPPSSQPLSLKISPNWNNWKPSLKEQFMLGAQLEFIISTDAESLEESESFIRLVKHSKV